LNSNGITHMQVQFIMSHSSFILYTYYCSFYMLTQFIFNKDRTHMSQMKKGCLIFYFLWLFATLLQCYMKSDSLSIQVGIISVISGMVSISRIFGSVFSIFIFSLILKHPWTVISIRIVRIMNQKLLKC